MSIFAKLEAGFTSSTPEETKQLALEFGGALPADSVLALHGDLGVGKTTFVQGLALALGIQDMVTSPTFNIFTVHRGTRTLVHLDAYRLEGSKQIEDLMLEDFLTSPYCLAIEWPEKIADWVPKEALHLRLSIVAGQRHHIALDPR